MEKQDLQLARKVLGFVHSVDELDINHPDVKRVQGNHSFEGSAVFDYDLDRSPVINLSNATLSFLDLVESHLRLTKVTGPWGLVNDNLLILKLENQPQSKVGKVLIFGLAYITDVLEKLFPAANLTKAEQRVLLQSLSGVVLKKAAGVDQVSFETKKYHLKNVFQKTQFTSQQALSNFLITHLTLELAAKISRKQVNAENDEMFFQYVDTFMGSYVRASVVQESVDNRFRIVELGDPTGRPVVCVHHLGLISFTEEEINDFRRNRIRLICPLRHGALGPSDLKITAEQNTEHANAGIDMAISLTGQSSAMIVSLLSGSLYAIEYLEKHPAKVKKLIMVGASYKPPVGDEVTSVLKKSLHDLASDHEHTLELTVSTMLESVNYPDRLKKVVKESNSNNDADNSAIDALFSDKNQVSAMQHRLRNSALSIVHDLKTQSEKDWTPLHRMRSDSEIHFIHGKEDRLIPIENIESLVRQSNLMKLHVVEGAGNWIFGEHTRQTSSIIGGIVDEAL